MVKVSKEIQDQNDREMDEEGLIMPTKAEILKSQAYKDVLTELRDEYPSSRFRRDHEWENHPEYRTIWMITTVHSSEGMHMATRCHQFTKLKETNDIESV